jgi:hypothetical protein
MTTLLSCQPPPPSGYVTVLEHECQFADDGGQLSISMEVERDETAGRATASRGDRDLLHRLMTIAGIQVALIHADTRTNKHTALPHAAGTYL